MKGQVEGNIPGNKRAGWLEGSAGLACDDVARVTDSGEAEGASLRRDQALRRPGRVH